MSDGRARAPAEFARGFPVTAFRRVRPERATRTHPGDARHPPAADDHPATGLARPPHVAGERPLLSTRPRRTATTCADDRAARQTRAQHCATRRGAARRGLARRSADAARRRAARPPRLPRGAAQPSPAAARTARRVAARCSRRRRSTTVPSRAKKQRQSKQLPAICMTLIWWPYRGHIVA